MIQFQPVAWHLGALHAVEKWMTGILIVVPVIALVIVAMLQKRRDRAEEQRQLDR